MSVELLPVLCPVRVPWNKNRIIGQKRPLLPRHVWSVRVRLEMAATRGTLLCSTWPSTASFVVAIWSRSGSEMSSPPGASRSELR